jgi:hypothetical protein
MTDRVLANHALVRTMRLDEVDCRKPLAARDLDRVDEAYHP